MDPPEYDDFEKTMKVPKKWGPNSNSMEFHMVVNQATSTSVCRRLFEDVDRGLITVTITAKHSPHSIDLIFTVIAVAAVTSVTYTAFQLLTTDIYNKIKNYYGKHRTN